MGGKIKTPQGEKIACGLSHRPSWLLPLKPRKRKNEKGLLDEGEQDGSGWCRSIHLVKLVLLLFGGSRKQILGPKAKNPTNV